MKKHESLRRLAIKIVNITCFLIFGLLLVLASTNPQKVAAQTDAENKQKLIAQAVKLSNNPVRGMILERYVTLKLSPQCWEKALSDKTDRIGADYANDWAIGISEHAKLMGYGDLESIGNDDQLDREKVQEIFRNLDGKFSLTIDMSAVACTNDKWRMFADYMHKVKEYFSYGTYGLGEGWRPRGGKMLVKVSYKGLPTKTVAVKTDGTNFDVTLPSDVEPSGWDMLIKDGMEKGGSKTE